MKTVFISHSTRDSDFARRTLKPYLEGHGFKAWMSEQDIPTTVDWERKIRRALTEAQWYVVVLSPDAVSSDWVQAEVHWALEKRKGRVVPILIRDCDPGDLHLKLLRLQYIDFRTDPNTGMRHLLDILGRKPRTEQHDIGTSRLDVEETTILGARETLLRFFVETGPQKGQTLTVRARRECIVGRGKDADLRILDDCVSRSHARLSVASGKGANQLLITDLESANGTYVNKRRILSPTPVAAGDLIDLGETRLRVAGIQ
jgi:hypothetical protein